jgi:hypothetical protein
MEESGGHCSGSRQDHHVFTKIVKAADLINKTTSKRQGHLKDPKPTDLITGEELQRLACLLLAGA